LVDHHLEVFIKKNLSTLVLGPGLGLVATAIGSCVLPIDWYRSIEFVMLWPEVD
jgi:hypothetical protein